MSNLETTPEELFALIGEREFIKYRQGLEIQKLYTQVEEMSHEISRLKAELQETKGAEILDIKRG